MSDALSLSLPTIKIKFWVRKLGCWSTARKQTVSTDTYSKIRIYGGDTDTQWQKGLENLSFLVWWISGIHSPSSNILHLLAHTFWKAAASLYMTKRIHANTAQACEGAFWWIHPLPVRCCARCESQFSTRPKHPVPGSSGYVANWLQNDLGQQRMMELTETSTVLGTDTQLDELRTAHSMQWESTILRWREYILLLAVLCVPNRL